MRTPEFLLVLCPISGEDDEFRIIQADDGEAAIKEAVAQLEHDLDPFMIAPLSGRRQEKRPGLDYDYVSATLYELKDRRHLDLPALRAERLATVKAKEALDEAATARALFEKLRERFEPKGPPMEASAAPSPAKGDT
jgi:hypothetical protein